MNEIEVINDLEAENELLKARVAELESENSQLDFKLSELLVGGGFEKLPKENAELRAELARIKPSWDDAPEWAEYLRCPFGIIWDWETKDRDDGEVAKSVPARETLEARPKGE